MRNFVPALEESLMKFTPSDITQDQPEAKYTARGGWFGVESSGLRSMSKIPRKGKKLNVKWGRA